MRNEEIVRKRKIIYPIFPKCRKNSFQMKLTMRITINILLLDKQHDAYTDKAFLHDPASGAKSDPQLHRRRTE
ncbi:hypothetical protein ABD77_13940 [Brevibacillus formosus]|nr:hypothetical protein [Brevibacillus formosus]